jgi:hypothetical protein
VPGRAQRPSILAGMVLLLASGLFGQTRVTDNNAHGWFNYFGDHPIAEGSRWGVHLEGQYRRHDVMTKWQQLLLRPAVNFDVNKYLQVTGGYAFAETWPYGDYPFTRGRFPEHRVWEQATIRLRSGKVAWSTRLRFENRWIGRLSGGFRYENRMRMMQRGTVPIKGKLYATAYDEFWFYVKPYVSNSAFDQNRAYGALGYKAGKHWNVEVGYMNQAVLQRSGRVLESNHTLMVSLISNAPFQSRH